MSPEEFEALASTGMLPAAWARRERPDAISLYSKRGNRTFAEVNSAANRLVRVLRRAGVKAGDGVAIICPNTPEFVESFAAKQRGGFRWTPVNTRLAAPEAAYIVENCEAKALLVHADLAHIAWPAAASPHLSAALPSAERSRVSSTTPAHLPRKTPPTSTIRRWATACSIRPARPAGPRASCAPAPSAVR